MAFSHGTSVGSGYSGNDPNIKRQMAQRVQDKAQVRGGRDLGDSALDSWMPSAKKLSDPYMSGGGGVRKVSGSSYWTTGNFFKRLNSGATEMDLDY